MWCESWKAGASLVVKVTPRASKSGILGVEENWIRLALAAPPVDGRANDAAQIFLSETLNVPKKAVVLLSGQTARIKRFAIIGITPEVVRQRLLNV